MVKWEEVKKPIWDGGLGLRSIRDLNSALQGKWLWPYTREEGKLWRRVVEARWGMEGGGDMFNNSGKPHELSLWKKICGDYNIFADCLRWKVGNSECIKFWKDV